LITGNLECKIILARIKIFGHQPPLLSEHFQLHMMMLVWNFHLNSGLTCGACCTSSHGHNYTMRFMEQEDPGAALERIEAMQNSFVNLKWYPQSQV
jgi:hypothetical protein